MLFAVAGMAVNIVLSFVLFLRLGPAGIPLAASFSGWLNAGLLILWLKWKASFSFDASVYELTMTLCRGGSLVRTSRSPMCD